MVSLTVLLALLGVMFGLGRLGPGAADAVIHHSTVAFGFMILAGFVFGDWARRVKLPSITGYILAGLFCGPDLLGLLSPEVVQHLSLFDTLALFLISLAAGGELDRAAITRQFPLLSASTLAQVFVGLLLVTPVFWAISGWIPFFDGLDGPARWALALLIATISVAKSPMETIAVIIETGARGPVRDFILGVTILMDVAVILAFTMVAALCVPLITGEAASQNPLTEMIHILYSILAGIGVGAGFIVYMNRIGRQLPLAILAVAILMVNLCASFHLEPLLVAIAAGYVIANHSSHGRDFIHHLEEVSLPVFLVFFGIAGASVRLNGLGRVWPFALLFVLLRILAKWGSTQLAVKLTGAPRPIAQHGWKGFIGQAGLTLGLAGMVASLLPGVGAQVREMFLAAVLANLLIGPILLKQGLGAAGEVPVVSPSASQSRKASPQGER
ncbi:MAG: cation:proton antiporter [Candidatus Cloacimonetes bacterium]|nr:cation:proton antiporter [Candidatus Cloacimonadota bacterium]